MDLEGRRKGLVLISSLRGGIFRGRTGNELVFGDVLRCCGRAHLSSGLRTFFRIDTYIFDAFPEVPQQRRLAALELEIVSSLLALNEPPIDCGRVFMNNKPSKVSGAKAALIAFGIPGLLHRWSIRSHAPSSWSSWSSRSRPVQAGDLSRT